MKRTLVILAALAVALVFAFAINQRRQALGTALTALSVPPAASTGPSAPSSASMRTNAGTTASNQIPDQAAPAYVEGRDYRLVPHPSAVKDPKIITIEEFFWYACPHCFRMESLLASWVPALPADVNFIRVPDSLGRPEGIIHQRAFYAAENLGVESKIHLPLMTALVIQHVPLLTPGAIANFVAAEAHVSQSEFNSQFASFVVDGEVRSATERSFAYAVTGVPSLIVGGRYLVDTDLPGINEGGADENARFARMLKVARYLVDKVRIERTQAGS